MELRFIARGTKLDIQIASDGSRAYGEEALDGTFIDTYNDLLFSFECPELLELKRTPIEGDFLRITFFRGAESYTFEGRLSSGSGSFDKELLYADAVSPIEKSSRRKSHRIQVNLPATLYKPSPDQEEMPGELLLKCTTLDISAEGLCLMSNQKLPPGENSHFIAELQLPGKERPVTLSVRHVRTGNCPQLVQYNHDHAFALDDESSKDGSGKMYELTFDIFKLKLEGRL